MRYFTNVKNILAKPADYRYEIFIHWLIPYTQIIILTFSYIHVFNASGPESTINWQASWTGSASIRFLSLASEDRIFRCAEIT